MNSRTVFVLLNIIGGIAVLGSYYWGFVSYPALRTEFWGAVPEELRGVYTLNMFFAASGYLAAFAYFVINKPANTFQGLLLPYTLVLIPSALWLPLTVQVLQYPSELLWYGVRTDLFAVGLGGIMIMAAIWNTPGTTLRSRLPVSLLLGFFVFQTAILDAIIWPAYFVLPVA